MADPLSFAASIIAVAGLAGGITSTISRLRAIHALPGRLHAVNNEVADLEVVLRQVAATVTERAALTQPGSKDKDALPDILRRANEKLLQLKDTLDRVIESCVSGNGKFVSRARAWYSEKPKIQELQGELHTIKASLNIMLASAQSRDITRVQLDLQSISLVAADLSEKQQIIFRDNMNQALERNTHGIDQRLEALESKLLQQFSQLQKNLNSNTDSEFEPHHMRGVAFNYNSGRSSNMMLASRGSRSRPASNFHGVSIRASQFTGRMCAPECKCACHARHELRSPGLAMPVLGHLFLGYAGMPQIRRQCDTTHCMRRQAPFISIEYWFPLWFLAQIIKILIAYQPGAGPQFQIRTIRRVPDSAKVISFILNGNVEGVKILFAEGLASPYDVDQTRNYSLLRWAVFGSQYNSVKFLMEAGADPQQEDAGDKSAERMWDFVLRGMVDASDQESVKYLLDTSDYVDDQHFPLVHKIVLGISLRDLKDELMVNPLSVFDTDVEGRTALHWAAARGDERSTLVLLSRGSNPSTMDKNGRTPLHLAADTNRAGCVRLLLEAGAPTNPVTPKGTPVRSAPLSCSAWNKDDDVLAFKTLLDFGADVEAKNPDGETALIATARRRTAAHAMLLMEHGADLNAVDNNGRTALTTAIMYNNHEVLWVLLDKWDKYGTCPRLSGPGLLNVAADFADFETIGILSQSEHLKLRGDRGYVLAAKAAERVRQRPNVSEDLILAFESLLSLMSEEEDFTRSEKTEDSLLECGLLRRDTGSSSTSDSVFEDALEVVDMEA